MGTNGNNREELLPVDNSNTDVVVPANKSANRPPGSPRAENSTSREEQRINAGRDNRATVHHYNEKENHAHTHSGMKSEHQNRSSRSAGGLSREEHRINAGRDDRATVHHYHGKDNSGKLLADDEHGGRIMDDALRYDDQLSE